MHSIRDAGGIARILVSIAFAWLVSTAAGRAANTTLDGSQAPIVRIMIQEGDVTVRTWDRPDIEVAGDPALEIQHKSIRTGEFAPVTIPLAQRNGPQGPALLPAESFVVNTVTPGEHDQVIVRAGKGIDIGNVTVTIPASTQLLVARTGRGDLNISGYRNGTLIAFDGQGRLGIDDFSGDAFAQGGSGSVVMTDSSFTRVRARSLYANMIFERCRAQQIEATSVTGDMVYDNGTFSEGLARFDSQSGNVAIGAAGGTSLSGHVAGEGKLYTLFDGRADVVNRNGDATAAVAGGGPAVNATSAGGNVFFYDGTLRTKSRIPAEWRLPQQVLFRDPFREIQLERQKRFTPPVSPSRVVPPSRTVSPVRTLPESRPRARSERLR